MSSVPKAVAQRAPLSAAEEREGPAKREGEASSPAPAVTVRTTDIAKVSGWREGGVFLEGLALADAIAEMNKYSQVQVRIDDDALADLRINGMFRAGQQQAFVHALEQYFPIEARTKSDREIVLEHR